MKSFLFVTGVRCIVLGAVAFWAIESIRAIDIVRLGSLLPWLPFLGGLAGYAVLWALALRRNQTFSFWETTDHELMHALGAILTLRGVRGLSSSSSAGGKVEVERPNAVVAMMPYLVSGPLLVVSTLAAICSERWESVADVLLGVAFSYHVIRVVRTVHPRQTDLRYLSFLFSVGLILSAIVITAFVVIGLTSVSEGDVGRYVARTWALVVLDFSSMMGISK